MQVQVGGCGRKASAADFEVPAAFAANSFRNFKSKSGTKFIDLLVPLCFRSFVSEVAAMYHELRKRGTSGGAQIAGLPRPWQPV